MTFNYDIPTAHPLRPAVLEFAAADLAYERMVQLKMSGSFDDFEAQWREFLRRIDRVWKKTQAAAKGRPAWQAIESKTVHLRKTDPLLNYLMNARNVDEHTVADVASEWNSDLGPIQAGQMVQVGQTLNLTWKQWDRPLLPIRLRDGSLRLPPVVHLNKPIPDRASRGIPAPIVAAELALRFYCDFLNCVLQRVFAGGESNCGSSEVSLPNDRTGCS